MLFISLCTMPAYSPNAEMISKIKYINRNLSDNDTLKIVNIVDKYSKKYNIDHNIIIAIFAHESMFKLEAKNCWDGRCHDFGIGQINSIKINELGIDKNRLLADLDYSIEQSIKILNNIKGRHSSKEYDWWTRYHNNKDHKRNLYKNRVCRYYFGKEYCKK